MEFKGLGKESAKMLWNKVKTKLFNKSVTDIKISGRTVTITKGDGTTSTQTTQDTNETYNVVSRTEDGLAPQAPAGTGTEKYLREDSTWAVPPYPSDASETVKGLMSADMVKKLNGVEEGANNYVHPTSAGNKHIPSGGSGGKILAWSADGTADWTSVETTVEDIDMGGLDVLFKFNGEAATQFTIPEASSSTGGVMSRLDKSKLDELPSNHELSNSYAKKSDVVGMYRFKGSVVDASKLPTSGQVAGDVYSIEADSAFGPTGTNVAWTSDGKWDNLGGIFTVTELTQADIDEICV